MIRYLPARMVPAVNRPSSSDPEDEELERPEWRISVGRSEAGETAEPHCGQKWLPAGTGLEQEAQPGITASRIGSCS
jgi:hypothetical protein